MDIVSGFFAPALTGLLIVTGLGLALAAFRLLKGPGYADRFVALDMMTVLAVGLCGLTSLATGRREFLDVGLGLAVFGFVATVALAAFLEKKVVEEETK